MRHSLITTSVACLFALCAGAAADTITLKSAARLRADARTVTLGDIASLEGDEPIRLAGAVIVQVKPEGRPFDISVVEVRKALDAAGINWAKVNLSGRSVIVRPARDPSAAAPQAMTPVAIAGAGAADSTPKQQSAAADEPPAIALDQFVGEQTVRGMIVGLLVTNLRIDARDVRARFDARDLALLETRLDISRLEVQPLGSFAGDRIEFAVRAWEGSSTRTLGQITLLLERRMSVTRLRADLPRDRVITDNDIETVDLWLTPAEALNIAPRASVVGRSLTRALHAGDMLRVRDLQQETLVNRGDLVTVRCLVGGVAISLQAEARADGGQGDAIEFRKTGERETFLATVTGRNQAVVDLSRR